MDGGATRWPSLGQTGPRSTMEADYWKRFTSQEKAGERSREREIWPIQRESCSNDSSGVRASSLAVGYGKQFRNAGRVFRAR